MAKVCYNYLGKSGLKVSNLCLGTMTFGDIKNGVEQCGEETAQELLDQFVDLGGNFIDTSDRYADGRAEEIIGRWLKRQEKEVCHHHGIFPILWQERKRFVISTKCFNFCDERDPNSGGLSRKHIMDAVTTSLLRLQTDYIDIFQIHKWDDGTPIEESFGALNDLVTAGKIRYIGVSNVSGWQLQKIIDISKARGWCDIVALQQQWSLMCRFSEFSEYKVARLEGVGVLPWSPLKGGMLSGKYHRGKPLPSHCRLTDVGLGTEVYPSPDLMDSERFWSLMDVLRDIAQKHGRSVSQVCLRWLLQKDIVSSVIIGVRNMEQLQDNMEAAAGWELTREQMERLDAASAIEAPHPYNMIAIFNKGR